MKPFRRVHLALFIAAILISVSVVSAQAPSKVLVLPFKINSEKDLAFLNRGVMFMISSRLAASGKTAVFQNLKANQAILSAPDGSEVPAALNIAAALQADYVVTGSLTIFGSSVSTDAQFISVAEKRPLVIFSQFGDNTGDVIAHIHQFAAQVNAEVFGLRPAAQAPAFQPVAPAPAPATAAAAPPSAVAAGADREKTWKSGRFEGEIRSMAAGDIDGDGKTEIVTINGHDVTIRRYGAGRLETLAEFKGNTYDTILGIDVADLNGNGRAEIFVTQLSRQGKLNSFVLEWSDGGLKTLADNQNWYFRVIDMPGRGRVLLGQKRGMVSSSGSFQIEGADQLFRAGVFEIAWLGRDLEAGNRLDLPRNGNIYGFTVAGVMGENKESIVAITNDDRLRIMERSGRKQWTGTARYPGSATFMEYRLASDQSKPDRYYLPQRIHTADLNGDGTAEVIVVKNKDIARGLLSRFRSFDAGRVECLTWDKVAMRTRWETEEMSGYISDAAVADIDGNGTLDLVFTVVQGEGNLLDFEFEKATSYMVVRWDIDN
ncbi:MAG: VCBS repeat-containing protein [Desulfobacterales bacterium]|nr:VCBS repeat-containing protein [Desulfobacterales bacterium]